MAPGNKAKTFTGSSMSKSRSGTQNSGSETKKKKKRLKKSAHGKKVREPEPVRCYSPLVYDPEVRLQELMQKHAKHPEFYKISDLQEYETNVTPQGIVRMGVSNHISRFEIPMDVKELEDMNVHEYLRSFCMVCKRRQIHYKKFFDKFDKDRDGLLSSMAVKHRRHYGYGLLPVFITHTVSTTMQDICTVTWQQLPMTNDIRNWWILAPFLCYKYMEMERALKEVYFNEIDPRPMEELIALTSEGKEAFDTKLFFSVCALSERMFYSRLVTEDTSEIYSETQWVETADFSALRWKFEGCNIKKSLKRLFSILYPDMGL